VGGGRGVELAALLAKGGRWFCEECRTCAGCNETADQVSVIVIPRVLWLSIHCIQLILMLLILFYAKNYYILLTFQVCPFQYFIELDVHLLQMPYFSLYFVKYVLLHKMFHIKVIGMRSIFYLIYRFVV
jgi:ABC-type xylose transport system permease subunit